MSALLLFVLSAFDWFSKGLSPIDTGAPPTRAQACGSCHEQVHRDWAASRHGRSWTNEIFQREYKDNPLAWCVHCHAPLREQVTEVRAGGGPLANEGITCVACHVREGHIWAREHAASSPHDTRTSPDFGGPSYCAGCHQFDFPIIEPAKDAAPAHVAGYSDSPMQDTVAQHAHGPRAKEECQTCHVRAEGTGHRFPGGHDAAFVARALAVSSCRSGDTLEVALANTGAGHNVPTGDLHRHLALRAWRPGAPERLGEALFGRQFAPDAHGVKRAVADTTIPPGQTVRRRFSLKALGGADPKSALAEPVRLEVRLVYTIDEFPFRGRELGEPTYVTMYDADVDPTTLPQCSNGKRRR